MRTLFARIGLLLIATLVAVGTMTQTSVVRANESASYKLYDTYPNDATGSPSTSTNYSMNESNMTWHQQPLIGSNFQILPAPLSSSSSSTTSVGGSSSSSSTGDITPGGCRGHACSSSSAASSMTSQSSVSAQSSSASSQASFASSTASAPQLPHTGSRSSTSVVPPLSSFFDVLHEAAPKNEDMSAQNSEQRLFFFHSVESRCPATDVVLISLTKDFWLAPFVLAVTLNIALLTWIGVLLFARNTQKSLALLPLLLWLKSKKKDRKDEAETKTRAKRASAKRKKAKTVLSLMLMLASGATTLAYKPQHTHAETTTPLQHVYNGHLLDSSGNPVTTAVDVRFSYWFSADYQSGDVTGTGAINTGSSNYGLWKERRSVTPDSKGYFTVNLGSVTALPDVSTYTPAQLQSLFMQVEVKSSGAADTAFEVLDVNSSDAAVDRSPVQSVPFALNADKLDRHDVGTGSGSIPFLLSGGVLPVATVPGGTNSDFFTIDSNNSASGDITLTFGASLNKTLKYSQTNSRFEFNDSVNIQGNLTVTGTINGVDITNISGADSKLRATSGAGLNLNVSAGGYRINGTSTDYAGGSATLANNTTSYVFLGSGGLKAQTTSFPTDESYIPVAQVTTAGGAITAINDKRIVSSDDREVTVKKAIQPGFSDATYQADASDNVGTLESTFDSINSKNFYKWTSTRPTLQDYDVIIQVPLSQKFIRWKTGSLKIYYRTTSSADTNNKLDISVFDTNGTPVTLTGTSTGLVSTSWTSTTLDFAGSPTWTAGQTMLIKIKVYAKDNFQAHIGAVELLYDDLQSP